MALRAPSNPESNRPQPDHGMRHQHAAAAKTRPRSRTGDGVAYSRIAMRPRKHAPPLPTRAYRVWPCLFFWCILASHTTPPAGIEPAERPAFRLVAGRSLGSRHGLQRRARWCLPYLLLISAFWESHSTPPAGIEPAKGFSRCHSPIPSRFRPRQLGLGVRVCRLRHGGAPC